MQKMLTFDRCLLKMLKKVAYVLYALNHLSTDIIYGYPLDFHSNNTIKSSKDLHILFSSLYIEIEPHK